MVRPATLHEQAAVFVEQELTKLVAAYILVLLLMLFTPCPGLLALALGTGLIALRYQWAGNWYYDDYRLDGRVAIVTGATAGIGTQLARELHERGARVVLACRDTHKAEKVAYQIESNTNANDQPIGILHLDLTSLQSVRQFVQQYSSKYGKLDILVNNAGIMWHPHSLTGDAIEKTLQVNHVAPFLLTSLLLDLLKQSPQGRIVSLSSFANYFTSRLDLANMNGEKSWDGAMQYCNTKLMNIMHVAELARRLEGTRVTANCNCPGSVFTDLISHVNNTGLSRWQKLLHLWATHKTAQQGAQTSIMLAVDPIYGRVSGKYFSDCNENEPNRMTRDAELVKRVWTFTEQLCSKPGQNTGQTVADKSSANGRVKK